MHDLRHILKKGEANVTDDNSPTALLLVGPCHPNLPFGSYFCFLNTKIVKGKLTKTVFFNMRQRGISCLWLGIRGRIKDHVEVRGDASYRKGSWAALRPPLGPGQFPRGGARGKAHGIPGF